MQRNHWRTRAAGLAVALGLLLAGPALAQEEAPAPTVEALQAELEQRAQQVTALVQALNARNLRIAELEAELEAKTTRVSQVEAAAAALFAQRDALRQELEQVKAERDALQAQVAALTEELEAAQENAQRSSARVEELEAQLAEAQALAEELERLQAERDRLQAALEEARSQAGRAPELAAQLEALQAEHARVQAALEEAQARLAALEGTASRASRSLEAVADELELALNLARALLSAYPLPPGETVASAEAGVLEAQLLAAQRIADKLANARGLYTVQTGDSLSSIAAFFYRDATRWTDILEANRDVLEDPDRLEPGMVLVIPR